jgi:hypothetical protein
MDLFMDGVSNIVFAQDQKIDTSLWIPSLY